MNEQLALWRPTIVSILVAVYTYGRLTERVSDHGRRLKKIEEAIWPERARARAAHGGSE